MLASTAALIIAAQEGDVDFFINGMTPRRNITDRESSILEDTHHLYTSLHIHIFDSSDSEELMAAYREAVMRYDGMGIDNIAKAAATPSVHNLAQTVREKNPSNPINAEYAFFRLAYRMKCMLRECD